MLSTECVLSIVLYCDIACMFMSVDINTDMAKAGRLYHAEHEMSSVLCCIVTLRVDHVLLFRCCHWARSSTLCH